MTEAKLPRSVQAMVVRERLKAKAAEDRRAEQLARAASSSGDSLARAREVLGELLESANDNVRLSASKLLLEGAILESMTDEQLLAEVRRRTEAKKAAANAA